LNSGILSLLLPAVAVSCVVPLSTPTPPAKSDGSSTDAGAGGDTNVQQPDGGTSQPLPTGAWVNVTANLANMPSTCGNMSIVQQKPDEDLTIVGIASGGLWATTDGAATWHALGTGVGSAPMDHDPRSFVFDPQDTMRYWESGIYGSHGGVYETTDDGTTFVQLGTVFHNDAVSVDLSVPSRATLLAGGHEDSQTLYRSTDGGMTWANVGAGLPKNTNCTYPLAIDEQTHLVGCGGYGGGPIGIYRTVDGGQTWSVVTTSGGAAPPLQTKRGAILWPSPNGAITESTDQGQTWKDLVGPNTLQGVTPVELPDGRIATLGTESIMVTASSTDLSDWHPASSMLPYGDARGLTYSSFRKAFYIWHLTCAGTNAVPPDAIMSFAFDYESD
jgi:hypothetical protein